MQKTDFLAAAEADKGNILTYSTLKSKTLDSSGSQAEKTFISASTVPHGGGAAREMWSG